MRSLALLVAAACAVSGQDGADFFESKVRPVLISRCGSCHGDKTQMAGRQFTTRDGMHRSGAVVAGDAGASRLIEVIGYSGKVKMPPGGKLPPTEIEALTKWVAEGAVWPDTASKASADAGGHWSLRPVRKPAIPAVRNAGWAKSEIDRFILAKLEEKNLTPVAGADPYTLLRRVTLDLTGLLPAPEEVEAFARDASPQAFERVVDRLLSSPAFGDRWGRHWLDVTYWADTTGVGRRIPLKEAWRYRDYVIDALNRDKPFDQFVREQVAGPSPKKDEKPDEAAMAATGFLVLGPWAWFAYDKAQTRLDIADLQVDLIGRSILGLTLGCARCHDHKFDPVTNKDYYAMAGIFLSTKTTSRANREGGINLVRLPETTAAVRAHAGALEAWEKRVAEIEAADKGYRKDQEAVRKKIEEAKKTPGAGTVQALEAELAALKKKTEFAPDRQIALFSRYMKPKWPEVYAAEEMEYPEDARIASRGDAHQLGEFVPRGFLSAVPPNTADAIDPHSSGRKELAAWLTDVNNPLPPRVYVNRLWHHLFGVGIVASTDNFGSRGEPPSHPELLDYLAARFMENGWSTKKMLREIVLSRVYQLSGKPDARWNEVDAGNRLLWRSNRRRLEAEAIRDTVLQVSGRLDGARGGPSLPLTAQNVHTIAPYFLEDDSLVEPHVKYRRTVYQPIMRNSQMTDVDILNLFDFKDPDQIAGVRGATTVPTQMLYLMNSPFLKEESRRLAERLLADHSLDDEGRVSRIVMAALSRPATGRDQEQARQFLSDFRAADTSAWARFCHAIFASSEFLYRR